MILAEIDLWRVRQWLKIDTQFCKQISVRFSQGVLVLQLRWQCATRNTIFFSDLSLSFFVNFVSRDTGLPLLATWDIWLLIACFVFQGESTGCCLFSTASIFEWLRKTPPPPLTGEQYIKMEPKYPEGVHCQSVLCPQGGLYNVLLYFNTDRKLSLFKQVGKPIQSSQFIMCHNTLWTDLGHSGCCIYDCNDHIGRWADWQLKFQTSYYVIMLLGPKNYFALCKFSLYKFHYIPVSLLWKWMDVWMDHPTTPLYVTI